MKISDSERNRFITEQRKAGLTFRAIAREFEISVERVRQIVLRQLATDKAAEESALLLSAVQQTNNLDHPWNRSALLNAINYPPMVRRLLDKHFYPAAPEVSLRQLMDWCLPVVTNNTSEFSDWLPAFKIKGFAQYCTGDLIRYIDRLNLGTDFTEEWMKRRDAFRARFCKGVEKGRRNLL